MARISEENCSDCESGVDHHLYNCLSLMITVFSGSNRFLSNFWPVEVEYEGVKYPSVENAYQAAKTTNLALREPFKTYTASQAKRHSHRLVVREDWNDIKLDVMRGLLEQKFAKGTELRSWLDNTKGQDLIEGNWWHDNFWGDCSCITRAECVKPGMNHLGKILMDIRDRTD